MINVYYFKITEVLRPKQQRMFDFFGIKWPYITYIRYYQGYKIPAINNSMKKLQARIFQDKKLFNQLEALDSGSINEQDKEYLLNTVDIIVNNFEEIENLDPDGSMPHEASTLFQILRFIDETYPSFMESIFLVYTVTDLKDKYLLMQESSLFHGELTNINAYLRINFNPKNSSPIYQE
jgi:hypothetical protein